MYSSGLNLESERVGECVVSVIVTFLYQRVSVVEWCSRDCELA